MPLPTAVHQPHAGSTRFVARIVGAVLPACLAAGLITGCESNGDGSARPAPREERPAVVVTDITPSGTQPASTGTQAAIPSGAADRPAAASTGPRPSTSPVVQRFERTNGLVIEDLRIGEGAVCLPGATITFRHRAFLPNGVQWEESHSNESAPSVPLPRAMPGWREGIPGMRVGGLRRLIIPPAMGFGFTGRRVGPDGPAPGVPVDEDGWIVRPGTVLTYEIELLDARIPMPASPPAASPAPAAKPEQEDQNK
ncbi:MAG: FKBP-type peptidyl-prolyl cis-trans isomerase [Phycisphaeraceae bacterium]|nr:FKBP-type peptidyl-prolyl cis-trans isomerase [Phycisphaeraceae bacterium]